MKRFKYGPDFLHPEFKKFVHGYEVKKAGSREHRRSVDQR